MICRDALTHGWVDGWMGGSVGQWVGSGHITKYQINLDLIKIIQLWTFWTFFEHFTLITSAPYGAIFYFWAPKKYILFTPVKP